MDKGIILFLVLLVGIGLVIGLQFSAYYFNLGKTMMWRRSKPTENDLLNYLEQWNIQIFENLTITPSIRIEAFDAHEFYDCLHIYGASTVYHVATNITSTYYVFTRDNRTACYCRFKEVTT